MQIIYFLREGSDGGRRYRTTVANPVRRLELFVDESQG